MEKCERRIWTTFQKNSYIFIIRISSAMDEGTRKQGNRKVMKQEQGNIHTQNLNSNRTNMVEQRESTKSG